MIRKWIIKMITNNPPTIAIAGGLLVYFMGKILEIQGIRIFGFFAFLAGCVLQVYWLQKK